MIYRWLLAVSGVIAMLYFAAEAPPRAQNRIVAPGWQGFALRSPEGKFDRCVLYNRSIDALTTSPYEMLGITRASGGQVGLLVFFTPRALTRGGNIAVNLKIDGRALAPLSGVAISDFHISVDGPINANALAALRQAKQIEVKAENKTIQFEVADVDAVLDTLDECVQTNGR